MYNLTKNNYHLKPKNSTIYTPKEVSQFIFELLRNKINKERIILDPCSGMGSLLAPWKKAGYQKTFGMDIEEETECDYVWDFLSENSDWEQFKSAYWEKKQMFEENEDEEIKKPALILCNPPFNGYKNQLGSEVWLDKIIELFGKEVPIVLFAPMGFRLNSKKNGQRWTKFTSDKYPAISSIISLPRDIFPNTEFHSEILIFNIKGLQPHYFYQPNE